MSFPWRRKKWVTAATGPIKLFVSCGPHLGGGDLALATLDLDMATDNPYASPVTEKAPASTGGRPTVQIDLFQLKDQDFECSELSTHDVVHLMREKLVEHCRNYGFEVVEEGAEYHIGGTFGEVTGGSRFQRLFMSLFTGILQSLFLQVGAARLYVTGSIRRHGQPVGGFDHNLIRSDHINFGGTSHGLIKGLVRKASSQIAGAVSRHASIDVKDDSEAVARYFRNLKMILAVVSIVATIGVLVWALQLPIRKDGLETATGKSIWSVILGICVFGAGYLFGIGAAPQSVLADRAMMGFRTFSGVSSIPMMRLVLFALLAAPLGMIYMLFWML